MAKAAIATLAGPRKPVAERGARRIAGPGPAQNRKRASAGTDMRRLLRHQQRVGGAAAGAAVAAACAPGKAGTVPGCPPRRAAARSC